MGSLPGPDGKDNEAWTDGLGVYSGNAMFLVWIVIAAVAGRALSVAAAEGIWSVSIAVP